MRRPGQVGRFADQGRQTRQDGHRSKDQHDEYADGRDGAWRQEQSRDDQHGQRRKRHQAAPEIVEYLPDRRGGDRVRGSAARQTSDAREQPARDLPISSYPTMAPADVYQVAGRVCLEELDVAQQAGPGIRALEQVMAEDGIVRKISARLEERIDVVDALADERALAEEVLIDVGHDAGIGIDPWIAGKEPDEPGAPGTR